MAIAAKKTVKKKVAPQKPKKATPVESVEETPIVTPEPVEENVPNEATEVQVEVEAKPDQSRLNDDDKMQSLINLLKILPLQYRVDYAMAKDNIWNIARFVPTEEQYERALAAIDTPPQRYPN